MNARRRQGTPGRRRQGPAQRSPHGWRRRAAIRAEPWRWTPRLRAAAALTALGGCAMLFYALEIDVRLRLNEGEVAGQGLLYAEATRHSRFVRTTRALVLRIPGARRDLWFTQFSEDAFWKVLTAAEERGAVLTPAARPFEDLLTKGLRTGAGQNTVTMRCRVRYAGLGRKVVYACEPLEAD